MFKLTALGAKKLEKSLKPCPCCNSPAIIQREGMHHNTQYLRVLCSENYAGNPNRCYIKTVAGPMDAVIKSWEKRSLNNAE